MGKRKSKKVQMSRAQLMKKRRGKLDKEFLCYYCQHEKSVAIKIDNQLAVGFLTCRICGVKFSTRVTALDEAVDVYALWMDACREGERLEPQTNKSIESMNAPIQPSEPHYLAKTGMDLQRKATERSNTDHQVGSSTSTVEVEPRQMESSISAKRVIREDELSSPSYSVIAGSKRSKRIIDAQEETPDEPEFTVDTLTGENLFDDD